MLAIIEVNTSIQSMHIPYVTCTLILWQHCNSNTASSVLRCSTQLVLVRSGLLPRDWPVRHWQCRHFYDQPVSSGVNAATPGLQASQHRRRVTACPHSALVCLLPIPLAVLAIPQGSELPEALGKF
jgi:hypothetical protein